MLRIYKKKNPHVKDHNIRAGHTEDIVPAGSLVPNSQSPIVRGLPGRSNYLDVDFFYAHNISLKHAIRDKMVVKHELFFYNNRRREEIAWMLRNY
jgi:hypothetical protein